MSTEAARKARVAFAARAMRDCCTGLTTPDALEACAALAAMLLQGVRPDQRDFARGCFVEHLKAAQAQVRRVPMIEGWA